jgi:DNA polymerase III subunit beta
VERRPGRRAGGAAMSLLGPGEADGLHVRVSTPALRSALATVGRATGPRRLGGHLDCVRLEARAGDLRMLCTDHCLTIEQTLAGVAPTDGEVLVPWSLLAEFARACPEPTCEIRAQPPDLVLVQADGRTATLRAFVTGVSPLDMQGGVVADLGIFSAHAFRDAVAAVTAAAATRDARAALTGVLMRRAPRNLTLAATDGRRLAIRRLDTARPASLEVSDVVVPAVHLAEVARCLRAGHRAVRVSLAAANTVVRFDIGEVRLQSRLLDVAFPRFEHVITTRFLTKAAVPSGRLLEDLRFVGTLLTRSSRLVTLEVQPTRVLLRVARRSSADVAQAAVGAQVWGDSVTVHLNCDDLLTMVAAMETPTIVLGFNGPRGTCIVMPAGMSGVVAALSPSVPSTDDVD